MQLPPFYPILDTGIARRAGIDPVNAAEQILDAGASIMQFRHKDFLSREAFAWIEKIADLSQRFGTTLVINDRADLAKLFDTILHLGQDDLPPAEARRIIGDGKIGFSTHNEAQIRAAVAEPIDYLALGPIFGTQTKENPDPCVGIEELRRLRPFCNRPLVAIGGITRTNVIGVRESGADSVAVIGDLFPEDGNIQARVKEWLRLLA